MNIRKKNKIIKIIIIFNCFQFRYNTPMKKIMHRPSTHIFPLINRFVFAFVSCIIIIIILNHFTRQQTFLKEVNT